MASLNWRDMPRVCKPKSGQANTKSYRHVKVWQPPMDSHGDWPGQGYFCLGSMDYAGPMLTTRYTDRWRPDRAHVLRGAHLVAWWHAHKAEGER